MSTAVFIPVNNVPSEELCGICHDTNGTWLGHIVEPKTASPHIFHPACIKTAFNRMKKCPTCRAPAVINEHAPTIDFKNVEIIEQDAQFELGMKIGAIFFSAILALFALLALIL